MLVYYLPTTPTPSQWKLPESGVYIWLVHPQGPEQGLAHSRCSINLGWGGTCEEMNEWVSTYYVLDLGIQFWEKNRSACCPHEVHDLMGEGNMKWITTKQRSNFDFDKRWSWDVKDEELRRSSGKRNWILGSGISMCKGPEEGQRMGSKGTERNREGLSRKCVGQRLWGRGCAKFCLHLERSKHLSRADDLICLLKITRGQSGDSEREAEYTLEDQMRDSKHKCPQGWTRAQLPALRQESQIFQFLSIGTNTAYEMFPESEHLSPPLLPSRSEPPELLTWIIATAPNLHLLLPLTLPLSVLNLATNSSLSCY